MVLSAYSFAEFLSWSIVAVSTPANLSVLTNLSVASDASIASEAYPPTPTAAPSARSGPIADRASDPIDDMRPPIRPTDEPALSAEDPTPVTDCDRPRIAGLAWLASCFAWPVARASSLFARSAVLAASVSLPSARECADAAVSAWLLAVLEALSALV